MTHKITRRNFLKIGTLGMASGILAGCQKPRRWVTLEPYVRPPKNSWPGWPPGMPAPAASARPAAASWCAS